MVIQILLYAGSSCTDKLTYIFSKRTHFNEQLMLLGFEFFDKSQVINSQYVKYRNIIYML